MLAQQFDGSSTTSSCNKRPVRNLSQRSLTTCLSMLTAIVVVSWKKEGVMKNNEQQANIWLFKVVIFFIVAGFLLSLIPLAKAQEMVKGNEHLCADFWTQV